MKRSSEIILVAALLAASFLVTSLRAGESGPADRLAALAAELGLTPEQKSALQAIREQERSALRSLREDTSLSREQKRERARAIHREHSAQRRDVLTADQRAQLKEKRAERGPGGRKHGRKSGPGGA